MAKQQEQFQALTLRNEGKSIGFIAKKLRVSKSTVSHWCKDIELTKKQIDDIAKESKHHATSALLQAAEKQRAMRKKNISIQQKLGSKRIGNLTERDVLMVGLGLYWGEGYKKGSQELGFTNSDPKMILFYLHWLSVCYHIEKERLILRISINQTHKTREQEVLQFWSELSNIPTTQFTKTSFIKAESKKQKYTEKHYGTLRVKVRGGTMLRHEILGSIAHLQNPKF